MRLIRLLGLSHSSEDSGPGQDPSSILRRRILSLPTLLSLGVAGAFIFFLSTGIDLDWGETWRNVGQMDPRFYVLALVLYYLSFIFRGQRWRMLADSASRGAEEPGEGPALPSSLRFAQLIIMGWFINAIAWLRLGDAYRAWEFSRESKRGFYWCLGTLVAERMLDLTTVALLIAAGILAATVTSDNLILRFLFIATAGMAGIFLALLVSMRFFGLRLARLLPRALERVYGQFHQGTLGSIEPRKLPALAALSVIGWALEAARLYFVVQALDLSLSIPMVLLVSLGHAVLSTVPTPGGIGAVETGMTGLLVLSMPKADAASVAVLDRTITLLSVIAIGGLVFVANHLVARRRAAGRGAGPAK